LLAIFNALRIFFEFPLPDNTINTSPYTFEDFKDYNIEIDGSTEGGFFLTIFFQNEKMIPSTRFNSYDDAHHHARMVIDKDRVTRMNS